MSYKRVSNSKTAKKKSTKKEDIIMKKKAETKTFHNFFIKIPMKKTEKKTIKLASLSKTQRDYAIFLLTNPKTELQIDYPLSFELHSTNAEMVNRDIRDWRDKVGPSIRMPTFKSLEKLGFFILYKEEYWNSPMGKPSLTRSHYKVNKNIKLTT